MRISAWVIALCAWLCVSQGALAGLALPEGTWDFNGDGYKDKLVLKVEGGKVTGTVYGNPIAGSYDPAAKRLNFVRQWDPKDPRAIQAHKGYLFVNEDGAVKRYTLAGTFYNIGNTAEMGWYARIAVAEPPVSGKNAPGVEVLDALMLEALKKAGGTAGSLTVTRGGETLYSRGYGWSDRARKLPLKADTPMIIASCDKPFTAAAIRQLARKGKLDLNASVLKVLKVKPAGEVVDKRVWDITIQHVLDHKAGWQGDAVAKGWQAYNGQKWPIHSFEKLLGHVAVQDLDWAPGTKEGYDNFGYNVLKTVVTHVSGRGYVDYLRHELLRPHGVKDLKWIRHGPRRKGEPPQLWTGLIGEDPKEYQMGVSTPALCAFMRRFWIDGSPRDNGKPLWIKTGGCSGSVAVMIWRPDGINVAWTFNCGADPGDALWDKAINKLIEDKKIPPAKAGGKR